MSATALPARRFGPVAFTFVASLVVAFAALAWVLPSSGRNVLLVAALMAAAYASFAAALSALAVGWPSLTRTMRIDPELDRQLESVVLGHRTAPLDEEERLTAARYALRVCDSQPVMLLLLGGFFAANAFLQAGMLVGSSAPAPFNAVLLGCFLLVAAVVLPLLARQVLRARSYVTEHADDVRAVGADADAETGADD
ncbi:MAG: hypothetical protein JWM51_1291 [Microbacteriaceae bacterium]|nr:hypothetical protein [Microbacteriaceae bacterium]